MDSSYNLGGLLARIKTRLGDQSYNEATATQFLNDSYYEILGEAHYKFLEKVYVASAQKPGVLPLPRNFQTAITITAKLGKNVWPVEYMDYADFLKLPKDAGTKDYRYTIFGDKLLFTVPDIEHQLNDEGEEQFYEITVYYLAKPTPLAKETDVPLIPYEFGEALVLATLARAEYLRDNFDYATMYENKKDELLTNMKLRYCPRQATGNNIAKLPVSFSARN